jgi:regulator of RNase E activity RraA
MNYLEEALSLIDTNKISTTEVADVLGKTGQVEGPHALTPGLFRAGEVKLIYAINNSNWHVHKQLAEADDIKDKILFIYNVNCDRAIFGDLVSKYIMLYKRAKAIVVNGKLRDAHRLIKERYPIWLNDVSPIGCVNQPNGPDIDPDTLRQLQSQYDGAIMVCDDSGVVMIPKQAINQTLINKLKFIELQEDIWFYCVDTLKMSTFDTVCEKKYLTEDILDPRLMSQFDELQKNL